MVLTIKASDADVRKNATEEAGYETLTALHLLVLLAGRCVVGVLSGRGSSDEASGSNDGDELGELHCALELVSIGSSECSWITKVIESRAEWDMLRWCWEKLYEGGIRCPLYTVRSFPRCGLESVNWEMSHSFKPGVISVAPTHIAYRLLFSWLQGRRRHCAGRIPRIMQS